MKKKKKGKLNLTKKQIKKIAEKATKAISCSYCGQILNDDLKCVNPECIKITEQCIKEYNDNWKDLVETNGKMDLGKVARELSDYWIAIGEVAKVYSEISGGRLSKITYKAEGVLADYYDEQNKMLEDYAMKDDIVSIITDTDMSDEKKINEIFNLMGEDEVQDRKEEMEEGKKRYEDWKEKQKGENK